VDPAHLTGWESCVWEYVILQNRCLVLVGTILILRTQMLPNLHQYLHDHMSQLLLKLLSTASSHLALRLSLKKKNKKYLNPSRLERVARANRLIHIRVKVY